VFGDFVRGEGGGDQRGPDGPGSDRVHPDPFIGQRSGQRFGEVDDRGFGEGVVHEFRRGLHRLDAGGVHDARS